MAPIALTYWTSWTDMWNALTSGQIIQASIMPFTNLLGVWFYLLIAFLGMMMVYFKWNDFNSTILVGIIILCGMMPFLAVQSGIQQVYPLIIAVIALTIAAILYKLVYKGG
jgi:hypothetical protein